MFRFDHNVPDSTNPFIGQYALLREHLVVQVQKGPSMLEEKLACPMDAAAHERRFLTAQLASSASNFLEQHVSIVARTIDMIEKQFLATDSIFHSMMTSLPPTNKVNTAGQVELRNDLMYLGDCTVSADKPHLDRIIESDLEDMVHEDSADETLSSDEERLLLEQTRKRRIRLYREKPADLRVNKRIAGRTAIRMVSKSNLSIRDLLESSAGL